MKNLSVWLAALLRLLLPSPLCEEDGHAGRTLDLAQAPRRPDPYVMRLPDPRDARWRRWSARAQARMFGPDPLPFPAEEWECWGDGGGRQGPHHPVPRAVERMAPFGDPRDPTRPYVDVLTGRHRV
ncbi:hypothetical protein QFZ49_003527 [Streptomyces turgidiscabies]|uniref:Uncharacterized protein n=1 Tax=Streptomyces turgidiscabies TaxID=85558 RepID=A0ABU0RQZ1_9ACTN|nr:hypothetical protein [Streptomyces turgidiscabies]